MPPPPPRRTDENSGVAATVRRAPLGTRTRALGSTLASSSGAASTSASASASSTSASASTSSAAKPTAPLLARSNVTRTPGALKPTQSGTSNAKTSDKENDTGKGNGGKENLPVKPRGKDVRPPSATPRRALSTVAASQTSTPMASAAAPSVRRTVARTPSAVPTAAPTRPAVRRALTAVVPPAPVTAPLTAPATAPQRPKARLGAPRPLPARSQSRSRSTTPAPPLAATSAPLLRPRTPRTPEDRIGINPLKRRVPTTYDRVDTKIRRLEPEEEKPRVVVYDDGEVEGCVPEVQVAFEPLSPAGVPAADVEEALEMAEGEEEECPSPRSPPRLVLDLPPIPDEDVSDLIDPEQLELDFGDLDLPDLHFIV